ncbi:uncharacterized protein ARMOST_20473 [Armillaria ostoyae]|uniref:ATP-dependent DNA helicase n=1 Tax=Armillaria ostoyae TaxID=47428 RepID=A0A284S7F5_ARMOS|nr:uncharacterized protein ARMOST_20473 [Armillaria ostoyae]
MLTGGSYYAPAKPDELWEEFKENICDDLAHKLRQRDVPNPTDAQLYDFDLHLINKLLQSHGHHLSEWTQMPASTMDWAAYEDNPLLAAQLAYDIPSLQQLVTNNLQTFNKEQKNAFDIVVDSVTHQEGKSVFFHSAGGGGKTFVCNTIAAAVCAQGQIVLTCASSSISAILLAGGCTSHSTFKIPIPSHDDTTCSICRGTHLAELLCRTSLIIWDEVPMQNRHDIETVDRTLHDICNKDAPFGGKTVLFGGDFRQTLPVVSRGSWEQIVAASFCRSPLWPHIKVIHLKKNMHLDQTSENVEFARWLLTVGSGEGLTDDRIITLPASMHLANNSLSELIKYIYPNIQAGHFQDHFFLE